MNFEFDTCIFGKDFIFNQNNNIFNTQNRVPFSDLTQQYNSFNNYKKNQPNNAFSKNFNDISNYSFLKKKSYCEELNNIEKCEECKVQNHGINKPKKYFNNFYKMNNSLINNLNEDDDEKDKENYFENDYENNIINNKDESINFSQILNDAINEKKQFDKIERDKKKANKLKQIKMLLKHRNNTLDYSNKENISNCQTKYSYKQEQKNEKGINLMNLD
jgi:hypothetical protein